MLRDQIGSLLARFWAFSPPLRGRVMAFALALGIGVGGTALPRANADPRLYSCARKIANLAPTSKLQGPLFARGELIFTSLERPNGTKMLLLSNGQANYSVPLESAGINRIRFQIRGEGSLLSQIFLSYLHGGKTMPSRVFEFSKDQLPPGRQELDYLYVRAKVENNLAPQIVYAVEQTAQSLFDAIKDGRMDAASLFPVQPTGCAAVAEPQSAIQENLNYLLDQLDQVSTFAGTKSHGGKSRSPASLNQTPIPVRFFERK
jgi:hypothetical protein